jgi:hypothetical protein
MISVFIMVAQSQPNRSVWLIYGGILRKCWDFRATIIMQQSLSVFLLLIDEAFIAHESWRKTKDKLTYNSWENNFKIPLNLALVTWLNQVGYAAGLLLKSLGDKAEQWWYFLNDPSVPPNNNLAERSLRLAVTKWKVSGGSRSMKRFEETAAKIECDSNLSFSSSFSNGFFP